MARADGGQAGGLLLPCGAAAYLPWVSSSSGGWLAEGKHTEEELLYKI